MPFLLGMKMNLQIPTMKPENGIKNKQSESVKQLSAVSLIVLELRTVVYYWEVSSNHHYQLLPIMR